MSVLVSIIIAFLIIGALVVVHELGHMIAAKACGIYVEEFAVGMGPVLLKKKLKSGMMLSLRLFPIGGFCQMKGESADDDVPVEPDSYLAQVFWKKLIVVVAGPFVNLVVALLMSFCVVAGTGYTTLEIGGVQENGPAVQAGVDVGDTIIKYDGVRVRCAEKVSMLRSLSVAKKVGEKLSETNVSDEYLVAIKSEPYNIDVRKADGTIVSCVVYPQYSEEIGTHNDGMVLKNISGLRACISEYGAVKGVLKVISASWHKTCYSVWVAWKSVLMLCTGEAKLTDLTGPIGITKVVHDIYVQSETERFAAAVSKFGNLILLLSANLAFLNLLPFPALDGSRAVLALIEGIRKKPLNSNVENWILISGFIMLMSFGALIAVLDIIKLLRG